MKAFTSSLRALALLATVVAMHAACSIIADSELADKPVSTTGSGAGAAGGFGGAGGSGGAGSGGETSSSSSGTLSVCNGSPCLATETCCKGSCVDLDTSTEHCGSCNKACNAGEKCCGGGVCAGCCADSDCPAKNVCLDGTCTLQCAADETQCGNECANLQTSTPHCGSCEIDCLFGHDCMNGVCLSGWAQMGTSDTLSPRRRAAAVWTGSALFVWGGVNDQGVLGDGALYDPKTDTWTPLETANAPSPRADAVAVLIDKRVLVWGGASTADANAAGLSSGKFYDLQASAWINIANDAPIGRRNPIATWTGARVLLWGGISNGFPISGGVMLDPNAMPNPKWTPMNTGNSPSARTGVAWAWSGKELLLFGGRPGGSGASPDGFAFDPATNTWRSLPTSGGPSGRFDAFGGWTGTAMLVYGGRDANNTFNDAFLYTPTPMDGQWKPAPLNPLGKRSAPVPRTGWAHTGSSQIVVAGGLDEWQTIRLEGQLYDSGMNQWGASIPAWPSGADHEYGVCVWTGTELILWSGLDNGALTAAGDRYRP